MVINNCFCLFVFSVPSAPLNVVVIGSSVNSWYVKWDPPTHMNGELLEYTVYYTSPDGSNTTTANTEEAALTGLEVCTVYSINVTATNGASGNGGGTSDFSESTTDEAIEGKLTASLNYYFL